MKKLLAFTMLILLFTTGFTCAKQTPLATEQTNNASYEVSFLFENDGCKVYRFVDNDRYHYYTSCQGETSSKVSCGKNCTRDENIKTDQ